MWPTFVGSHENSRRFQPLQKARDHPQKTQCDCQFYQSRKADQWLSLCASQKALTASDVLVCRTRRKGELMRSSLDLFRRNEDGEFIWLEAGEDLKAAKLRLQELSASAPGEYLLFDRATAQIIERLRHENVRVRSR
jgi:hypothetical protein